MLRQHYSRQHMHGGTRIKQAKGAPPHCWRHTKAWGLAFKSKRIMMGEEAQGLATPICDVM